MLPYTFFVQTLTGLLVSCEIIELNIPYLYHTVWNALPHELQQEMKLWQIQLLTLPPDGSDASHTDQEEALLEIVRQGGVLYLLVQTDHRLDTFVQQMPFDFQCSAHPGVTFVRRIFKACYHTDQMDLSWRVDAYVGFVSRSSGSGSCLRDSITDGLASRESGSCLRDSITDGLASRESGSCLRDSITDGLVQEGLLLYHSEDVDRETGWDRRFTPVSTDVTAYSVLELIYRAYHHQSHDWQNTPCPLLPALYLSWEQLLVQELGA